jgi:flagellar biosynthesis/type III secretory pathway protein FliH
VLLCVLKKPSLSLTTDQTVFGPEEIKQWASLGEASLGLSSLCEEESARIAEAVSLGREQGRIEGFEAGKIEAENAYREKINMLIRQEVDHCRNLSEASVLLAIKILKRMTSELGASEVVPQIAKNALLELRNEGIVGHVKIFVHPKVETSTRRVLSEIEVNQGGVKFDVKTDENLSATECFVETSLGSFNASLDYQLNKFSEILLDEANRREEGFTVA